MDAMISDYSSVWGDYLLVDRPLAFVFDDLEEYRKDRCIPLEPIEEYMPGMKVQGVDGIVTFLDSLEQPDMYIEKRQEIRELFLKDVDDKSAYRFLREIGLV